MWSISLLWFLLPVGLNLTGSLVPEIGGLVFLQKLLLKDNSIGGTLPSEISDLHALKALDLSDNQFRGRFLL